MCSADPPPKTALCGAPRQLLRCGHCSTWRLLLPHQPLYLSICCCTVGLPTTPQKCTANDQNSTKHSVPAGCSPHSLLDKRPLSWRACRDEVNVEAKKLFKAPAGVDPHVLAGLETNYGTTYHALKDCARIQPGERLCVLGAAGAESAVQDTQLLTNGPFRCDGDISD